MDYDAEVFCDSDSPFRKSCNMHQADRTEASPGLPQTPIAHESSPASSASNGNEQHQLDLFRQALLRRTPTAVFTLLIVLGNVTVYLWMIAKNVPAMFPDPVTMIAWGANYAPRTLDGELWRLLTSMFLHFGALHLGMNMLALWNLGRFVERMFGNAGFLLLYLLSGLAGSLASVIWNPVVVSAGASGAIFGVAGGLLGGAWKLRRSMPPVFLRSAWWLAVNVLVLLIAFSVINRFQSMIDNAAHVAGFVTGSLIGLILAEPLPNPGRSRRGLRNLIVAVTGTVALYLAVVTLAQPPVDVAALQDQYQRVESQTLRKWESAHKRLDAGAITPEEYATVLETEILPAWKDLHQDFQEARNVPKVHQEWMAELLKVIALREAGWEREIEALREQDPKKAQESAELFKQADDIIQRLNREAKSS
jgi:rhomboid protease GluP